MNLTLDACKTRLDLAKANTRVVGEQLLALRTAKGYSTRHLSEVSGVRIDIINRAEKGTQLLSPYQLTQIWTALTGPFVERAPKPDEPSGLDVGPSEQ